MGRLDEWAEGQIDRLLARFVHPGETSHREVRKICGYLESWVSIIVNLLLFVLKYILGTAINSVSSLPMFPYFIGYGHILCCSLGVSSLGSGAR